MNLKPCPKCKSTYLECLPYEGSEYYSVMCLGCAYEGNIEKSKLKAIKSWNDEDRE